MDLDLRFCLERAIEAARLAWKAMEPFHQGDFQIYEKEGEGPATDADLAADSAILQALQRDFPPEQFGYLTEETGESPDRLARNAIWIIDPIDGTREFIQGRDDFAVHIGLAVRDGELFRGVLGVVYVPREGKMYHAISGGGAFLRRDADGEDQSIKVNETPIAEAQFVVTRARIGDRLQAGLDALRPAGVMNVGSFGVKAMTVADGRAGAYLNTAKRSCKEWDACAPAVIVEEAGGIITDLRGEPLTYNKDDVYVENGVLAAAPGIHAAALPILRDVEELAAITGR